MRFEHDGQTYAIDFFRRPRTDHPGGVSKYTYPYTTVNILEVDDKARAWEWKVYRTWTVGCWHRDKFTNEMGRIAALRGATKGTSLSREFKAKVWDAYMNRGLGL